MREAFGFERLIAPVRMEDFLESYYEQRHLVVKREMPLYYAPLFDLETVLRFVEMHPMMADDVTMVKFGETQLRGDYIGADNRADPRRVLRMFDEGWTMTLDNMERFIPALGALCRMAEHGFSARFQANLYLTPPKAQGFRPHWDTHDVFVLQVHGSKAWSIYDTKIPLPLTGQSFNVEPQDMGPVSDAFVLNAGDLLYIPRGLMHAAHTSDDTSLHITFGLMARTWADLMLEAVAGACLTDPRLRRNLPIGFARDDYDREQAAAVFEQVLAGLKDSADFSAAFADMRDRFIVSRIPSVEGQARQIAALDRLTPDSLVGIRPNSIFHVEHDDETATVAFGGSTVTLPAFTAPTLRAALAGTSYRPRDLPGELDDEGKLTLVRRLIREGLIVALDV
jgi:ribosomal protein L16 Arg81 hydroxylase